jgi:hypothetical protein
MGFEKKQFFWREKDMKKERTLTITEIETFLKKVDIGYVNTKRGRVPAIEVGHICGIEFPIDGEVVDAAMAYRSQTYVGHYAIDYGYYAIYLVWKKKDGTLCFKHIANDSAPGGKWQLKGGSFKKVGPLLKWILIRHGGDGYTHESRKQIHYPSMMRSCRVCSRKDQEYLEDLKEQIRTDPVAWFFSL